MKKPKTYKYLITLECSTTEYSKVDAVRKLVNEVTNPWFKLKSIKKSESITTRSAKNKGAKFQNWVAEQISNITGIKWGKDELISPRQMGSSGTDVALIGKARELMPYAIECKNNKSFSIPAWVEQAKSNQSEGLDWLLFITKNDYDKLAIMDAEVFFKLCKKILDKT